jgi:hypothetical protein
MASETAPLGLVGLARPLPSRERTLLREDLRRLIRFHRTLSAWPRIARAPDATPIVAVYEKGTLAGCAMSRAPQSGAERLRRAFLAASASAPPAADPPELAVEVTYALRMRWVEAPESVEVGTEGIAFVRGSLGPVLLMPQVARDLGVDDRGFLALLHEKAQHVPDGSRLAAWTTDRVVGRRGRTEEASQRLAAKQGATETDYAAAWLARLVDEDGAVAFAIDPRRRILQPRGELHHARSAIAIESLARHGGHEAEVARARRRLARDIEVALGSGRVDAWPASRAAVAGTLALATWAGVDLRPHLRRFATDPELAAETWHAAQVALALGSETPERLWSACIADLDRAPFAPWTALAARAVGDEAGYRKAASRLAGCIRPAAPHEGGADVTRVPECGLTAVAAHALLFSPEHQPLADRALSFVRARQLLPGRIPAALDPTLSLGAFSATPVDDVLRADIVGHALSALLSRREAKGLGSR